MRSSEFRSFAASSKLFQDILSPDLSTTQPTAERNTSQLTYIVGFQATLAVKPMLAYNLLFDFVKGISATTNISIIWVTSFMTGYSIGIW